MPSTPAPARPTAASVCGSSAAPLTADDVAAIRLQESEASEHRFVTRKQVRKLLRPAISRRVDAAWDAAHCVYLEDGRPVPGVGEARPR